MESTYLWFICWCMLSWGDDCLLWKNCFLVSAWHDPDPVVSLSTPDCSWESESFLEVLTSSACRIFLWSLSCSRQFFKASTLSLSSRSSLSSLLHWASATWLERQVWSQFAINYYITILLYFLWCNTVFGSFFNWLLCKEWQPFKSMTFCWVLNLVHHIFPFFQCQNRFLYHQPCCVSCHNIGCIHTIFS